MDTPSQPTVSAPAATPIAESSKRSHVALYVVIALVVIGGAAYYYWTGVRTPAEPLAEPSLSATPDVGAQLDAVDTVDIDAQLKSIDADLNQL